MPLGLPPGGRTVIPIDTPSTFQTPLLFAALTCKLYSLADIFSKLTHLEFPITFQLSL